MEVAIANNTTTTNTNNNQHHSHSGVRSPFQREVREWQRIDPSTGALLTGRLEADRWINGPLHSYGKISDSQNIAQPNGTQVSQKKQLEVLQQRTASGAMQVIRAQTVQSTSSRWSSSATSSPITTATTSARTPTINGYSNNSESNNNFSHNSSLFQNNHTHLNGNHYNFNNISSSRLQPMLQAFATASSDDETSNNSIAANGVDVVVDHDDVDENHDNYDDDNSAVNENHLNNGRLNYSHQRHQNNNNNYSNDSSNISSFSNFLLLDTAPSLKLSNLMKSSSSVSSNSNSSTANVQNFTSNNNNNNNNNSSSNKSNSGSGSKLSLHAIVGNTNSSNSSNTAALLSTSSSTTASFNTTTTATNTAWQRQQQQKQPQQQQQRNSRLFEQLPTFGKINSTTSGSGFTKSRVGGAIAVADDDAEAEFDGRVTFNSTATDERSTLQLTPTHLQRRDLESFRHYNDHQYDDDRGRGVVDHRSENVDVEDNDADLRLSMRHKRRQQIPISSATLLNTSLQRGRSISTDDLSTEWDPHGDQTMIDEPSEWKRVSKLRRSFQSPATTRTTTTTSESYNSTPPRRPLDLPASSVSVSKIRAELENGRRLTTAMRNNHVDMAALQSILNSSASNGSETKPVPSQRTTFLTAESLKEIRNKLKKLSDESLYKEDFVVHQLPPLEHIEIREVKTKPVLQTQLRQLTPERSPEISALAPSAFKLVAAQKQSSPPVVGYNISPKQHTTNSLESRQKYRDTSSAEWHLRRKSYGFEKMLPPDENNMFRMDASTDSGLGRSGELNTWSPTETVPAARSTVVHFGEPARVTGLLQRRYQHQLNSPDAGSSSDEQKRHSIAFDDSQYVRKTSQVRFNGNHAETESSQTQHYDTDSPTNVASSTQYYQRTQQKRVEFCKTEVHFAAESGRVNIVETDGKPPPTNNFRRRRRTTSGPLQSLIKGASISEATTPATNSNVALPITRFGDDNRPRTLATTTVAYKASLVESSADAFEPSGITITLPKVKDSYLAGSRNSYASTSGIDTTDNENDDIAAIRGILKNKPIKPKPYHLGENFESPDVLWGVQLKPINTHSQRMVEDTDDTITKSDSPPLQSLTKSVAERVHNVEKRQDLNTSTPYNGFSTKINLSLSENSTDWKEQELPKSNIMSIALHSPQASVEKSQSQPTPVARQRTTTAQPLDSAAKEPLRIIKEARGARKLREHELSFFGVPIANSKTTNITATQQTTTTKRTLPQRNRLRESPTHTLNVAEEEEHKKAQSIKWNLTHDRPDLLHHTEHSSKVSQEKQTKKKSFSPVKPIQYSDEEEDAESENFYENLTNEFDAASLKAQTKQTAKAYSRQRDLERDEKILSEMTHTADQTMKALSDEAVLKNQRRRSLTRRNSKPLETIDEKSISEKISDKCIAVKVSRSTLASEAKRHTSRQATHSPTAKAISRTRTSSQSSVESCSRARSRSLSSEREYEHTNTKPSARSNTKHTRHAKPTSRSSSRDSQHSSQTLGSSGDELYRRDERLRTKTKRSSSALLSKTQSEKVRSKEYERKERDKTGDRLQQPHARSLRATPAHRESSAKSKSSSTTRSSQRECVECVTDATHTPQHSSSRRHRSENEKRTSSSRSAAAAAEKLDSRAGSRLVRGVRSSQDYDSSQRSSNRSERSATDKEKLSRSRGHSSRSTAHTNESKQQHSHQHTSSPSGTKMRHNSEQRKSTSATAPSTTADNSQTLSKNAHAMNGISAQRQQHHHHPAQHVHSLTAATIATKQRERSGKDRK